MSVKIGTVRTFADVEPDKAQALKPLEEAAEVFGAWQNFLSMKNGVEYDMKEHFVNGAKESIIDEIADCITACCNLAESLGAEDLAPYMEACEKRNAERGRYESSQVLGADGMECHVGDRGWWTEEPEVEISIERIDPEEFAQLEVRDMNGRGNTICAREFTHEKPVMAGDGKPIKVGETVYDGVGRKLVVTRLTDDRYHVKNLIRTKGEGFEILINPKILTHEQPDTWERIESEALKCIGDYFGCHGSSCETCTIPEDMGTSPGYFRRVVE